MITLGGLALMFAIVRIFVFKMPESPRYLLSKGRDAEAVESVNYVARRNGKPEPLSIDMFQAIDSQLGLAVNLDEGREGMSSMQIMKENLKDLKSASFKDLFATKKLGRHTAIIWFIWLTIGNLACIPCSLHLANQLKVSRIHSTLTFYPLTLVKNLHQSLPYI